MYPLRSILFLTELVHLPRQTPPDRLQQCHGRMFADETCRYTNFQLVPGGAQVSNPVTAQGAVSAAWLLGDRVRVQEQHTGLSQPEYRSRLDGVVRHVHEELQVDRFLLHRFVIQSLINPRSQGDSRDFLLTSLLQPVGAEMEEFDQGPTLAGLRLVFPIAGEPQGMFQVRVESYQRDARALFLEVAGVFPRGQASDPATEQRERIQQQFLQTYDFLGNQVVDFIARFDEREAGS